MLTDSSHSFLRIFLFMDCGPLKSLDRERSLMPKFGDVDGTDILQWEWTMSTMGTLDLIIRFIIVLVLTWKTRIRMPILIP
jgi:hypothetical protein